MTFREAAPRQGVYILRFWETRSLPPDAPVTWRFSAQDPRTGERRGFADLDGLMSFLAAQTRGQAGAGRGSAFSGPASGLAERQASDSAERPALLQDTFATQRHLSTNHLSAESTTQNAPNDGAAEL
jgi:hypothetical protein